MYFHLKFIGILLIALAIMHIFFSKYFNWKKELSFLSLINKEMMIIHTFFIALTILLMGLFCLTSTNEMIETTLGRKIALGFAAFWFIRLLVQFFGYSSALWRNKIFETFMHILFTVLWSYLSIIFFKIWLG